MQIKHLPFCNALLFSAAVHVGLLSWFSYQVQTTHITSPQILGLTLHRSSSEIVSTEEKKIEQKTSQSRVSKKRKIVKAKGRLSGRLSPELSDASRKRSVVQDNTFVSEHGASMGQQRNIDIDIEHSMLSQDKSLRLRYEHHILALLEKHKRYPKRARQQAVEGSGMIQISIDRTGRVTNYFLKRSTGHRVLDSEIINMVKRASPFPPMPENYFLEGLDLAVPVSFWLR